MRRWALLALLLLAVWAQEDELVSKRVYLRTPASFVNLTSDAWRMTDDTEQVLVAVRFRAQSAVGRILSSQFLRQDGRLEAELTISLDGGQLQVDLFDSEGTNILRKPLVQVYMNETSEHSVAVKINSLSKTLTYSVEQRAEHTAEITKDIQWAGAEILTTLGGGPQAVIGCVALISVQVTGHDPLAHVVVVAQNEVDKCPTESECAQRNCGKGRCLALEVATCDCFSTGKTGPNCGNEPKTVELNNNDDTDAQQAAVIYTPWKEDQKIRRLAMEFKFKGTDFEGVLMYGLLEGGGFLKMYAVQSLGTLTLRDKSLNFTLKPNSIFHSVALLFEEKVLQLWVDDIHQTLAVDSTPLITSITFGSSPTSDGVADIGLTACLRNVYVDHFELLELQSNRDPRVSTPKVLKSCSDPNEVTLVQGSKVFPADMDLFPGMDEEEEDEPEDEDLVGSQKETTTNENFKIHQSGFFSTKKNTMPCEKSQEYLCRNGATCMRGSTRPTCQCAPGYGGAACQFSLFPRTCAEATQFHRLPEGPTRLDVDASGDLSMSVAECRDGATKIVHDMPSNTPIRASEVPKHGLFVLSYMDFTPAKLESLIAMSGNCRQQVNYKCNHAPLHFADKRTWFRVASGNSTLTQMGAVPNGCQCIDIGCANQGRCNCDAGNLSADEGVLQGRQAGITSIVSLHREGDVSGEMTVSPLECSGFASESNAIRFLVPGTYQLDEWTEGTLSLHFRTADASSTLFRVDQGEKSVLRLELLDGHTVKAVTDEGEVVVESQAKLNDTKWHLVVLEWHSEELRVSVDVASSFSSLKTSPYGNVTLGDLDRGVVGCIRSVLLGRKTVELKGSIDGMGFGRCEDSCLTTTCRNGAECRENFSMGMAQCTCKHPRLHSGFDCSHDINSDTSVSFHGGFLKFEDQSDPLKSSWVLSFRTDQSSALLLYIHDENNNFLQLHVKDEVNVTLSLNNLGVSYSCTVQAPPGTEYSNMQWVQVYIDHSPTATTLTVEEEACTIRAARILANEPLEEIRNWGLDLVKPPVGIDKVQHKFVYAFIGGVQRAGDDEGDILHMKATYTSKVEDLLGCLRGVKVGNQLLDLRAKSEKAEDKSLVQVGCNVNCDLLLCQNGGHCSVAWRDFNPASVKTTCDCSRTSYAGPHCLEDDGVTFVGQQTITFDAGALLEKYILSDYIPPPQTLKLAFNADPSGFRQMLAIVYFNDSSEFEILLNKNGSLHAGIVYADGRSTAITFKGNFTDGYRHFLVARFSTNLATRLYVDGVRKEFLHMGKDNLSLYRAKRLWLGGQRAPPGFESGAVPKKNLQGCMSNVHLDFGVNILNFNPLSYLDSSDPLSNLTLLQPPGKITHGSCAAFRNPNQPISLPNVVSLPVWETNFRRLDYLVPVEQQSDSSGGVPWLVIILAIILVIIFIGLIVVVICLCRKGHKDAQPQNISLDEREPLRQTQFPQTPPIGQRQPHSNYSVPPPDIQLPPGPRANGTAGRLREEAVPLRMTPRSSLLSQPDSLATTAYFTAQEDFSDEDLERTLTPGSEAPTVFEDEISRPMGFDRSSPQRLSSFRDSSAPIGSPLYAPESNRRLRPVSVPKPPIRTSPV